MNLKEHCYPVVDFSKDGDIFEYTRDVTTVRIELKTIDKKRGIVSCPLFDGGKCDGIHPCVVNEEDPVTTVQQDKQLRSQILNQ